MMLNGFLGSSLQEHRHTITGFAANRGPAPFRVNTTIEAAHKKGGGSTKNGRDSNAQRRGVKVYGGQPVKAGGIIIRQVGSTVHPGAGVGKGKDFTLYALQSGIVVYQKNKYIKKVSVIDTEDYEIPEGCRRQPGSRKEKNREANRAKRQTANVAAVVKP